MRTPDTELIEREVRIDAPPSAVFAFLTDPAKLVRWLGTDATLDPRPGGRYRVKLHGGERVSGKVVEIVPDRLLVFTWGWEDGALPVPPGASTVELALQPDGNGTLLRLTHRDLPPDMRAFHRLGWEYALPRLATVAAGRDPGPDPLRSTLRRTQIGARSLPPRHLYRLARRHLRRSPQRRDSQPD